MAELLCCFPTNGKEREGTTAVMEMLSEGTALDQLGSARKVSPAHRIATQRKQAWNARKGGGGLRERRGGWEWGGNGGNPFLQIPAQAGQVGA